jgi:hypothetical protein
MQREAVHTHTYTQRERKTYGDLEVVRHAHAELDLLDGQTELVAHLLPALHQLL